jgi:hypothetical protein
MFKTDGPRADQLRLIVVFLHAAFEVLLRSHLRRQDTKLTFCGKTDLDKAFQLSGIDSRPFKPLYPPLIQMAKRRIRIVHEGDLSSRTATNAETWSIADSWQLIMWNLAVLAFYYQLREAIGAANVVELEMLERFRDSINVHVAFGRNLIALTTLPPEEQRRALINALENWTIIAKKLQLSVGDFD